MFLDDYADDNNDDNCFDDWRVTKTKMKKSHAVEAYTREIVCGVHTLTFKRRDVKHAHSHAHGKKTNKKNCLTTMSIYGLRCWKMIIYTTRELLFTGSSLTMR